jgi:putative Flp pilus-assembly TadE/G-like protein
MAGPVLSERGGVLVMVAVWLPVLLVFLMFVVEVGNWFEHKRHLQMQADSGAFAGGDLFNACFTDTATGSAAIDSEARRYAGDPSWAGALGAAVYNSQIGGSNRGAVTVRVNRKTFQVGGPPADDTIESGACTAKMVDIKVTEANLPWFFKLRVVPAINAHARVEVKQKDSTAGSLPVGVPDNNPLSGAAIFVNESAVAPGNAVPIAVEPLTKVGPVALNGQSLVQWTGSATPVNINSAKTGVVIAMSGLATFNGTGTLSQICGQALVECYQGADTGPWVGLSFIHGYSSTGTGGNPPIVRDVILYNQGCSDGSGPYFLFNAACTIGVKAKVDFGTGANDPTRTPAQGGVNAQLKVDAWNCPNSGQAPKGCVMTYNGTGANAGYWTTNGPNYPLMPANGVAHTIDLNWGGTFSGRNVNGTLTGVQRSFSAGSATSGPVDYITVSEIGPGANSLLFGSHNLSVTIGVKTSLQRNTQNANDPPVALKVVGGSQNQAVDCEDGKNLRQELATGCAWHYAINKGTPCPDYNDFNAAGTWDCVRTQTGGQQGQVYQGMLERTQGGSNSCVNPNNWVDVDGDGKVTVPEDIPLGDPRIVPVFVTPFGSFNGSGNNVVPVVNFATFYVTGFSHQGGSGQGDPCPGADPVPGGGYIMGHFIKYVDSINSGSGGSACDFNAFGTCVAVLTQ